MQLGMEITVAANRKNHKTFRGTSFNTFALINIISRVKL